MHYEKTVKWCGERALLDDLMTNIYMRTRKNYNITKFTVANVTNVALVAAHISKEILQSDINYINITGKTEKEAYQLDIDSYNKNLVPKDTHILIKNTIERIHKDYVG
jgi:hypothetical protein